jgi:hypothetical protein
MNRFAAFALLTACSSGGSASDGGTNPDTGSNDGASANDASTKDAASSDGSASDAPNEAATKTCTNPVFTTSDLTGGQTFGAYYLYNDMWNTQATLGPQTLYVCNYDNWYAVSNQKDQQGAVLTYPNVHEDFANVALNTFKTITSSFAESSPHVGIYEDAYDIWFNGFGNGHTELMIWVDNQKQVPSGAKQDTQSFSGHTYDVYRTGDGSYIALVATANFTSGTIDLLQVFQYLVGKTWITASAPLSQIDFGVEVVDTAGAPATYTFTDFSITAN